jgi:molybdate transport system ATP-binding protein
VTIRLDRLNLDRSGRPVLRDLTWTVSPGERWLVLGPNGAGKTQLLKVLAGDVWPNPARHPARRYRMGRVWQDQPHDARDEIAYLGPERQDRYERHGWNFRAVEVVGTGVNRTDIPLTRLTPAQRSYCVSLLRRAGIARLANRKFLTLSYGERRLVLLARAWAWRPAVLLLDEAATGLDEVHRQRLQRFLAASRSRRIAWVCTSHRAEDAPASANRLLVLDRGRSGYCGRFTRAALMRATRLARAATTVVSGSSRSAGATCRGAGAGDVAQCERLPDGWRILSGVDMVVRRGQCWVVQRQ